MGGEEEERRRLEQFRSWHDEAFLYINQAVTQEADNIGRLDVALLMYQRGLGLVDLALCVNTSGEGTAWAAARKKQEKMGVTVSFCRYVSSDRSSLLYHAPIEINPQLIAFSISPLMQCHTSHLR